jgi:hypothetical protein
MEHAATPRIPSPAAPGERARRIRAPGGTTPACPAPLRRLVERMPALPCPASLGCGDALLPSGKEGAITSPGPRHPAMPGQPMLDSPAGAAPRLRAGPDCAAARRGGSARELIGRVLPDPPGAGSGFVLSPGGMRGTAGLPVFGITRLKEETHV